MQSTEEPKNMSRSQPNERLPNPATRWFDWNGEAGNPKYYDKELKENVQVALPFEFILLDRLNVIKGWHNNSESGITSNEVRDTRKESLFVRAFKQAEPIAEGFYSDIRDKVKANGGKFTINCYIAFTDDGGELALGSFQLHGAAMSAWIEFENRKDVRPSLYKSGIKIVSTAHGEKGSGKKKIEWEAPVFELVELPQDVNDRAAEIDRNILQPYLQNYFKRARTEQAAALDSDPDRDINQELATQPEDENQDFNSEPF